MDKRSWPWKKKSSEKAAIERALSTVADSTTSRVDAADSQVDQVKVEIYKKPKIVQISVESYSHLMGLEDQVKSYEEQVKTLEEEVKDLMGLEDQVKLYEEKVNTLEDEVNELNEKLSTANTEMINKDNLVKQQAKVAEDAISGWEKAETETAALRTDLESVTLLKLTAEDRASHLDGALKECMRQIRNLKEDNEQKLQELALVKTKQFDRMKLDLESKIAELDQQLLRSFAENDVLSRSLQERSNTVVKLSGENSQAEAEIERLRNNIKLLEKDINSLRYELHVVEKELEIRNEEKNMSARSAEVANKQHLEGLKKIAKLEAECQRLRGLVKKKLPGPAALAQMKLEVENLDREYGESRLRRSPVKSSSPHKSTFSDLPFDGMQYQKENELLTGRLLAMEEETKMLKEALAKRNNELQTSRSTCASITNKLKSLEAQLLSTEHNSPRDVQYDSMLSRNGSNRLSLNSLSEDGNNDDDASCPGSWATASMSDSSHIKRDKSIASPCKVENGRHLELMDDFAEMEKLAYQANGADLSSSDIPSNLGTGNAGGNYVEITMKGEVESNHTHDRTPLEKLQVEVLTLDAQSNANQSPFMMIQSTISLILGSLPDRLDKLHLIQDVLHTLQDMHDSLKIQSSSCTTEVSPKLDTVHNNLTNTDAEIVEEKVPFNRECKPYSEIFNSIPQELETAISQIHDFVMFLGKEVKSIQATCSDRDIAKEKLERFSASYNAVMDGSMNLMDFVLDLSLVLTSVNEFNMLGCKYLEAETSSCDYIDKVALPENKDTTDLSMGNYPNGCPNPSDSLPEAYLPHEENPVPTSESKPTLKICSMEEYEQLKQANDDMLVDLSRCTEDLETKKSQLQATEQLLSEVKSQLTAAQKMNRLTETQLRCMAESYNSLEARAEELQKEVNVLRDDLETRATELQVERKNYQDALVKCKNLEEQMMRIENSAAEHDPKTSQVRMDTLSLT